MYLTAHSTYLWELREFMHIISFKLFEKHWLESFFFSDIFSDLCTATLSESGGNEASTWGDMSQDLDYTMFLGSRPWFLSCNFLNWTLNINSYWFSTCRSSFWTTYMACCCFLAVVSHVWHIEASLVKPLEKDGMPEWNSGKAIKDVLFKEVPAVIYRELKIVWMWTLKFTSKIGCKQLKKCNSWVVGLNASKLKSYFWLG